jgi:hypothetical protein
MKKSKSGLAMWVLVVVALSGTFYGGMKYDQTRRPKMGNRPGIGAITNGNSFIGGEILSKDDKSITIKLPTGGSKIIFVSDSTQVTKSATGSLGDLTVGQQVSVNGKTNTDSSITATTVSLRPVGALDMPIGNPTNSTTTK